MWVLNRWLCYCDNMQLCSQIAGCKGHYTLTSRQQMCVDTIKHSVGEASVLVGTPLSPPPPCPSILLHPYLSFPISPSPFPHLLPSPPQSLVSGGVDSAVCTALLLSALGPDKVIAVHIDNGFMRKGESEQVKTCLEDLGLKLHGNQQIVISLEGCVVGFVFCFSFTPSPPHI